MKKTTLGLNGRIVIPKSMRNDMNIVEGSPLIITYEEGAVVVRADKATCVLCGYPIESGRTLQLCDKCTEKALEHYLKKKK